MAETAAELHANVEANFFKMCNKDRIVQTREMFVISLIFFLVFTDFSESGLSPVILFMAYDAL